MLLTMLLFMIGAPLYSMACRYTANLSDPNTNKVGSALRMNALLYIWVFVSKSVQLSLQFADFLNAYILKSFGAYDAHVSA